MRVQQLDALEVVDSRDQLTLQVTLTTGTGAVVGRNAGGGRAAQRGPGSLRRLGVRRALDGSPETVEFGADLVGSRTVAPKTTRTAGGR